MNGSGGTRAASRLLAGLCVLGSVLGPTRAWAEPATGPASSTTTVVANTGTLAAPGPTSTSTSGPATVPATTTTLPATSTLPAASTLPGTVPALSAPTTSAPGGGPASVAAPAAAPVVVAPAVAAPAGGAAPGTGVTGVEATSSTHGTVAVESGSVGYTPQPGFTGAAGYDYTVCDADGEDCSAGNVQLTVTPAGVVADDVRAPSLDQAVPTSLFAATAFLYTGPDPLQQGVAPGTIERRRVAVLRGIVRSRSGEVLPDVGVAVRDHPELGRTRSRANGTFDLVVNGGGFLTVSYSKDGLAPAERQVDVPWGDYVWLPDVVLVPRGPVPGGKAAVVAPGAGFQAVLADGSTRRLPTASLRLTEYAAGPADVRSLPAALPAGRQPGYVFDLGIDEAARLGARQVKASRPVATYVENVLGLPSGEALRMSRYDWSRAAWVPAPDGRVVTITGVADGRVQLDGEVNATAAELAELARLYPVGTTLWRLPVAEAGTWAAGPEGGATLPVPQVAAPYPTPVPGAPVASAGAVAVAGSDLTLRSPADQASARRLTIPVFGADVPAGVERVEVEVVVAGSRYTTELAPGPGMSHDFAWDGRDGYGRVAPGRFPAVVTVTYVSGTDRVSRTTRTALGATAGADTGVAGWMPDGHAVLDVDRLVVAEGRSGERSVRSTEPVPAAAGPGGVADAIATGPDGSVYVSSENRIRRIDPQGNVTLVAGSGSWGFGGDGGPALRASFRGPRAMAVGTDGSLYVVDGWNNRVRRITPSGLIWTVAGNGRPDGGGLGRPAAGVSIGNPTDVAAGPDGRIFVVDGKGGRVLEVGTDGILRLRLDLDGGAGTGSEPVSVAADPGGAAGALIVADSAGRRVVRLDGHGGVVQLAGSADGLVGPTALAAAPDGSLVFLDAGRVLQLAPGGTVMTLATPSSAPSDVALGPDGVVRVAVPGGLFEVGRTQIVSTADGELAVPSADGASTLVFDPFGRHLRTVDAADGHVLAGYQYDGSGRLAAIEDGSGTGAVRVERDDGGGVALVSGSGRRTALSYARSRTVPSRHGLDIPPVVLAAYRNAADVARRQLACDMRWSVLAAIGRIESDHGRFGKAQLGSDGDVSPAIVGIPLDGRTGTERVPDTDGGVLDGDTVWDRAVGPLQFLPATWRSVAADGNGDGRADVQNVFDAALGAARYLCRAAPAGRLGDRDQLARAVWGYNHSGAYVATVLADVDFYDSFDPAGGRRALPSGTYALPLDRALIDADPAILGKPHRDYAAVDLPAPLGSRVFAVAGGKVVKVDPGGDCGNGVIVDSTDGYRYTYCHADRAITAPGDDIVPGELIMLAGSTGHSTGPHLHLQIARPDGTKICPQPLLQAWYRGQPAPPSSAPTRGCY